MHFRLMKRKADAPAVGAKGQPGVSASGAAVAKEESKNNASVNATANAAANDKDKTSLSM